jgi:hypothetical protein
MPNHAAGLCSCLPKWDEAPLAFRGGARCVANMTRQFSESQLQLYGALSIRRGFTLGRRIMETEAKLQNNERLRRTTIYKASPTMYSQKQRKV